MDARSVVWPVDTLHKLRFLRDEVKPVVLLHLSRVVILLDVLIKVYLALVQGLRRRSVIVPKTNPLLQLFKLNRLDAKLLLVRQSVVTPALG